MTNSEFMKLMCELIDRGYGEEIEWQQSLMPCVDSWNFAQETVWVILNSGMKEQIARQIKDRIYAARNVGKDISEAFGHKGKVAAIKFVWDSYDRLFNEWIRADNKIEYLQTIPFIGKITCWHLAKNLGVDCVKPDRHLVRIADMYGWTPDDLCSKLSNDSGLKKCTVDIILWRAANLKLI